MLVYVAEWFVIVGGDRGDMKLVNFCVVYISNKLLGYGFMTDISIFGGPQFPLLHYYFGGLAFKKLDFVYFLGASFFPYNPGSLLVSEILSSLIKLSSQQSISCLSTSSISIGKYASWADDNYFDWFKFLWLSRKEDDSRGLHVESTIASY